MAQQNVCMNNQKQLGLSLINYADDHDGRFVPGLTQKSGSWIHWPAIIVSEEYVTDPRILLCPDGVPSDSHTKVLTQTINQANNGNLTWVHFRYIEYGLNKYYIGSSQGEGSSTIPYYPSARVTDIRSPASTIMLGDSRFSSTPTTTIGWSQLVHFQAQNNSHGVLAPLRHNDSVTIFWADGHASMDRAPAAAPYSVEPFSIKANWDRE